jgi:hypothetical protein
MKQTSLKSARHLILTRDTIRQLESGLADIAGGVINNTNPTHACTGQTCPTDVCGSGGSGQVYGCK